MKAIDFLPQYNALKINPLEKISEYELESFAKQVIELRNEEPQLQKKLQEFGGKYPNQQLYLGYKLIDLGYGGFCIKIIPEKIQHEKDRLKLAQKLASGIYAESVINSIDKFDLKDEKNRVILAQLIAKKKGFALAKNIEKFNIQDEKERLELAKSLVEDNGNSLIYNIEKFNISNETDRFNLAKSLIEKNGYDLAYKIDNFNIQNSRDRIGLAKELILRGANKLILNLEVEVNRKRVKKFIDIRDILYASMLEKVCQNINSEDGVVASDIAICKELIGNIKRLKTFYEQPHANINFDVGTLLKEDNARDIMQEIENIGNVEQKQFVIETVEKMLFIVAERNLQIETTRKDEIARLILEFTKVRNPELKLELLPMMLTALSEEKLSKIYEEIKHNSKSKAYPAIYALVFDKLSLYKEDEELLSDIRKVFSKNSFLKNSKDVCDTLMALIKLGNLYLGQEETKDVVRFLVKNANDISKNCRYIMSIISFGDKDILRTISENSNPSAIKELFYSIYNNYISVENNEEFMEQYEKFINLPDNVKRNFEELLMSYVSNNKDERYLVDAIKKYLTTMTDIQKFRDERYDITSSEHLKALDEIDSEVFRKWSKGQKEFEGLYLDQASSSSIPIKGAQITDDPVDLLLIGTEIDGSCQHVNGMGYNKALMGYVIDGKNKAVVIKNEQGRIIARSIIRLLIEEGTNEIVMTKEKLYKVNGVPNSIDQELNKACIEYAKWLGVSLVCNGFDDKNKCQKVLVSKGGMAPYEYVDMNYGMTMGKYEIIGANLIYLYKKGSDDDGNRED